MHVFRFWEETHAHTQGKHADRTQKVPELYSNSQHPLQDSCSQLPSQIMINVSIQVLILDFIFLHRLRFYFAIDSRRHTVQFEMEQTLRINQIFTSPINNGIGIWVF